MARSLRTRLNRIERRHAHLGDGVPSVEAVVPESAALRRWLTTAGYDSPHAALAAGVRTPASFRLLTLEDMAGGEELALLHRWRRSNDFVSQARSEDDAARWRARAVGLLQRLTDMGVEATPA